MKKALEILKQIQVNENYCNGLDYCSNNNPKKICGMFFEIDEAIAKLEALDNDLKDLFSCIELTEDENAEKRLSNMETYLMRLASYLK